MRIELSIGESRLPPIFHPPPSAVLLLLLGVTTFGVLQSEQKPVQIPLVDFEAVSRLISHRQFIRVQVKLHRFSQVSKRTLHRQIDHVLCIGSIFQDRRADAVRIKRHRDLHFKILKAQGLYAPGGKYSYVINGNMVGGYALVACLDKWGNSGLMTFIINQQGRVYQKNPGPNTAELAERSSLSFENFACASKRP